MKFIDYFSNLAMPLMIIIIVLYGVVERKKVFDIFLDGAKDGIKVVFNIFPTLVGLFVAIGALRSSGIINLITNFLTPFLNIMNFPTEILPLALIRPISGSSSIAVATDIMKTFGVDSILDLWLLLLWVLLRLRFILLRCILVLWVLRRQDLFCGLRYLLILLGLL